MGTNRETSQFNSDLNFPALTGYRVLAATLVYFHHFNPFAHDSIWFGIVNEGHVGVTLFFVLSGFLITHRYSDSYRPTAHWWRVYMQNRLARIYPVLFFLTVLSLKISAEANWRIWLTSLTMTKAWFDEYKLSGISPAWSLSVEEVFYLLAPIFLLAFSRIGFWLTLAACYVVGAAFYGVGSHIDFHGFFATVQFTVFFTFWGRAFEFLLGMGLALRLKSDRLPKALRDFKFKTEIGLIAIAASLVGLYFITDTSATTILNATYDPMGLVLNNLVLPPFICLLIWGLIEERSVFARLLSTPPMQLLGQSSYVFYLVQQSVLVNFILAMGFGNVAFETFPALLVASTIFYLGFEKPLHQFFRYKPRAEGERHLLKSAA